MTLPLTGAGPSAGSYAAKVLSYSPIAYWPLWEATGSVAECLVNSAQNGAYTGVTLGQPGIGDGKTCPLFDGSTDFVNIYTTTFRDAFNGAEGTVAFWGKAFNAGVWTDDVTRYPFRIFVDVNNNIGINRYAANNNLIAAYKAGGIEEVQVITAGPSLDWFHIAITWSKLANEVRYYLNGSQNGSTDTGLGVWAGVPIATSTILGAGNTTPTSLWYGYLAHCASWDTPLAPAGIADLAVV